MSRQKDLFLSQNKRLIQSKITVLAIYYRLIKHFQLSYNVYKQTIL